MLIQFSVENFLSIKDNVVLSLLASKDNEHPEHLIVDGNKKHLKSAVIYGANASGKSNVLNAFWFMVNYVLTSHNQQPLSVRLSSLTGKHPLAPAALRSSSPQMASDMRMAFL